LFEHNLNYASKNTKHTQIEQIAAKKGNGEIGITYLGFGRKQRRANSLASVENREAYGIT